MYDSTKFWFQSRLGVSLARALPLALFLATSACAPDRDLDQWRRQELQKSLDELKPIEGVFRGVIRSQEQDLDLGALEISFAPRIRVVAGGPSEKAQGQPVLATRVIFEDRERRIALTAPDSFFDPDSGTFEISFQLTRSTGRTEQVRIGGYLWKESTGAGMARIARLEGSLEASGNPETRTQFSLVRNSTESLSEIAQKSSAKPWVSVPGSSLQGITLFEAGQARTARLVVTDPEVTPEEAFLNRFAPLRVVQFSLNYGETFRLVHDGALWDERTRKLTGRARIGNVEVQTECGSPAASEWECSHFVAGLGRTATSRFPSTGTTDPDPSSSEIQIERVGGVTLSRGQSNRVWLQVARPPRSRGEDLAELFVPSPERFVTVSLQFGLPDAPQEDRITVVFESARLDLRSGTLDAVSQIRAVGAGNGSIIEVRLSCVHVVAPNRESTCSYTSTQLGSSLRLVFPALNPL